MKQLLIQLKNERFFWILAITFSIIFFGAVVIFFVEGYYSQKGIAGLFDAFWWAVVTIATVGYGDIVPKTILGKMAGLIIIFSGPALLSLVTASVASILVERKIKEGKGLEVIKDRDHIVICGWNENGEQAIDGVLTQSRTGNIVVALVNELDRDDVQSIQYKYKDSNLRFVRGNFVKEDVLARANLVRARAAIVLADISGGHSVEKADERTIFATMAIKAIASKVRTCAELINADNREHLIRANVDEVIVRGGSAGSMLAKAAVSPGLTNAISMLLNDEDENKLWRVPVPGRYVGRSLVELALYLRQKTGSLVLAVLRQKKLMTLEDILSDDSTTIDAFIKRKFEESGKDFFGSRSDVSVLLNPPDDYVLASSDWILVVSRERPMEAGIMERLVGGN